ncbi:MAG TPA: chemotaxis protein CheW, partial [Gammaproteobacteria bacterium]
MQPVREVYSLLMPVQDGRIIVPRAAVAEVMGYSKPKDRPADAPAFLLGFIEWQNQRIPLISFEAARGRDVPEFGRRTRIAVVFGIAGRLQPDVFAVVTQGYPYLVRVNENVLQREEMESEDRLVLARVRMANEKPYIPNFERLEMLIAESLGIAPVDGETDISGVPVDELDALGVGDEDDFDMNMLADAEDAALDVADGATDGKDDGELDVDLGEVTAFGAETNYSTELDELSEAVDESGVDSDADG